MIVEFDAFDLVQIALFAERQRCVKRANAVESRKYDESKGEYEAHYIGAMGEWAVHKETGAELDKDIYPIGDDGTDMLIGEYRCQIKAFTFTAPKIDFFVTTSHDFRADIGIGVQILSPIRTRIMGCISRRKFLRDHQLKNYSYGDRLAVSEDLLSDLSILQPQ